MTRLLVFSSAFLGTLFGFTHLLAYVAPVYALHPGEYLDIIRYMTYATFVIFFGLSVVEVAYVTLPIGLFTLAAVITFFGVDLPEWLARFRMHYGLVTTGAFFVISILAIFMYDREAKRAASPPRFDGSEYGH